MKAIATIGLDICEAGLSDPRAVPVTRRTSKEGHAPGT
jgi:hypothetical protein